MKDLSFVFLEKSELQHRRNSVLIALLGIPSISGSQNDMLQWNFLRSNIAYSDPGEFRVMKKNLYPETGKKVQIFTFLFKFLD